MRGWVGLGMGVSTPAALMGHRDYEAVSGLLWRSLGAVPNSRGDALSMRGNDGRRCVTARSIWRGD
jgi:hypothetical protein